MQHIITYVQLYRMDQDIKAIQKDNPGIAFLLDSKIKLFYQRANISLLIMNRRMGELQTMYIQHDEKDNPKRTEPDEKGNSKWLYKESVTIIGKDEEETIVSGAAVEKLYEDQLEEFMATTTKIDF